MKSGKSQNDMGATFRVVLEALVIALIVRTFLFQPFNIPSSSLVPTLLVGDYLFTSKYAYGYSKHSFPFSFLPFEGRIFGREPKLGDIAVFKLPSDNSTDYIKRVVGLPGDRIQMIQGRLYRNSVPVPRKQEGWIDTLDDFRRPIRVPRFRETLSNGASYFVIETKGDSHYLDNTPEYTVPPGHFFMMGDNRDNSSDSRDMSAGGVGFVPFENFIGRAEMIFFSADKDTRIWEFWAWSENARFDRFFSIIR